ncbi:DUF7737 domain-containing protein [Nonomuraea dietziae]|uniref:DUF7737 domain-containing protein n=1 Tax=Nonomuraea dietziae TaxID=65515 RepID=UPI00341BEA7A
MGVLDGLPAELRAVLDELDPATLERCRQFDATLQGGHPYRYPDDTRLKPLAVDDAGWRAMALWTQLTLRTTDGSMPSFAVLESPKPDDAYLCIVPRGSGDQVFLPFEEDGGMLSIIISKAFLLAADTAISDPSITRQIHP